MERRTGCSVAVAAILAATRSSACHGSEKALPTPRTDAARGGATSSAHGSASAAPPGVAASAGNPREIPIQLETEPASEPDGWYVVAKSPQLSLNVRLTEFKLPFLCGVAPFKRQIRREGVLVACPMSKPAEIGLANDKGRLWVDSEELRLPPGVRVTLPTTIEQPKLQACGNEEPLPPFVVGLQRRLIPGTDPDEPAKFVFELGLGDRVLELFGVPKGAMACTTSRVFPKSDGMTTSCASEATYDRYVNVQAKDQTLLIEWWQQGIHADEDRHRVGFRLPCGAPLRLQPLRIRDPKYNPRFGAPCGHRCSSRDAQCKDACYDRWADDYGRLAPPGEACIARCDEKNDKCVRHCQSIGQYP